MSDRVAEGDEAHLEYAKWICATKKAYANPESARPTAAARLAADPTLKALYAYRCSACGTWHLTKKKRGKPLAVRQTTPQTTG